ncbi:integrase, catalytic region, zinc finger, CCHC-type containing protein [Tanacetum coccineum]|uniref:Integrase, catalytic region, zinc finger, CCHC-type containing protein n=1 Tax=Tanacetum coccineum TaxID=301880 RepID=A0ABQ4WGC7_9ASTR
MGTVRFGNDHFAAITGYGDYVQGNITICHVYYVEGLGHNLFSVGQFCDGDRESNLYPISIPDMVASSPVYLMSKASSIKSWLWNYRLSHLNFGTINDLTKHDLVDGLSKFKYGKDHLYSACEWGKSKKASHPPKLVPSSHSKLEVLHIDLCGPMKVASINGKKYILVIVDDYSRFTWIMETIHVKFDELTAMASEYDSLEPVLQRFINNDSSAESMNTLSKEDLDNLLGPMYDEYFEKKCFDIPINSAAQQVHNQEDSSSTSLIDIEAHESPPIVITSEE